MTLTLRAAANAQIAISWTAVAGARSYDVMVAGPRFHGALFERATITGTSYTTRFLPPSGGQYSVAVNAHSTTNATGRVINSRDQQIIIPRVDSRTVTFNVNGGNVLNPSTRIVANGAAVGSLPVPTRFNHNFTGWWTAATGGTQVNARTIINANITFIARWNVGGGGGTTPATRTVTFNPNGGTVNPTSRIVMAGTSLGALPRPTRPGHSFTGWWTFPTGGTPAHPIWAMTANTTLFARWQVIPRRPSNRGNNPWNNRHNPINNGRVPHLVADPIDVTTGAFIWDYTLFEPVSNDNLGFSIHYNSQNQGATSVGNKWAHSYSYGLDVRDSIVYFTLPNGEHIAFVEDVDTGIFRSEADQNQYSLTKVEETYIIRHISNMEFVFGPHLQAMRLNGLPLVTFSNNEQGQPITIQGRHGMVLRLQYQNNLLASVSDPLGYTIQFAYEGDDLVSLKSPEDRSLSFEYDTASLLTNIYDFMGVRFLTNSYNNAGQVIDQSLLDRGQSQLQVNAQTGVTTYTDELGNTVNYRYDPNFNVSQVSHALGDIHYSYNDQGQLIEQTDELGDQTLFTYDDKERLNLITHPDNTLEATEYNDFNQPTRLINTDGTEVSFVYDERNNLLSETDEGQNTDYFAYDNNDNLTSHTDKNGESWEYTYDNQGQMSSQTDPLGYVTTYEYDGVGKLLHEESPEGQIESYEYSPTGDLLSATTNDHTVYFTYDENGNCLTQTDHLGNTQHMAYDAMGNIIKTTDPLGNESTYNYNEVGQLISHTDPVGYSQQFTYDALGNVTSETDANGHTTSYVYNEASQLIQTQEPLEATSTYDYDNRGRLTRETDPLGNTTSYAYDNAGRVIAITDALGNREVFSYNETGQVLNETDKNGNITFYKYDLLGNMTEIRKEDRVTNMIYDANGQLIKTVDALGYSEHSTYDGDGQTITQTDKEGNITSFVYDTYGHLTQETDALGNVISYTYDANGNRTSVTDACGHTTSYEYDATNKLIAITDPLGYQTQIEYSPRGELLTVTTANNDTFYRDYDGNGNLTKETNPLGGDRSYTYDANDRVTEITDENGYTQSFEYDANGNLVSETDANGNCRTLAYDALNRVHTVIDDNGEVKLTHDNEGNVLQVVTPDGATTVYEYNVHDQLVKLSDPLGNSLSLAYDLLGRVTEQTDANGNTTNLTYTPNGHLSSRTDAIGNQDTYTYNEMGWLTKKTEGGITSTYSYDALGQIITASDALGNTITFTYTPKGDVETVTDPNGNASTYSYDPVGNLKTMTDAKGHVYHFEYDGLNNVTQLVTGDEGAPTLYYYDKKGQRVQEILPTQLSTSYAYDGNGNLISKVDADDNETVYTYNFVNQISAINYACGKQANLRYNSQGELVELEDWNGTTNFERDLLGRILKVTDHEGNATAYSYDAVGNKASMTYPTGQQLSYAYNQNNQLQTITDDSGETTTFSYGSGPHPTQVQHSNGSSVSFTFAPVGGLSEMTYQTASGQLHKRFAYDPAGNLTELVQNSTIPGVVSSTKRYNYDQISQLIGFSENGIDIAYTYDGNGNRIRQSETNQLDIIYSYNELNQLLEKQVGDSTHSYTYDNRGNLQQEYLNGEILHTHEYDSTNRLVTSHNRVNEHKIGYGYNGFGVRIEKYLSGNENVDKHTKYVTDYTQQYLNDIVAMQPETGETISMVYGENEDELLHSVAYKDGVASKLHHHSDMLGSSRMTTNPQGQVVAQNSFDPWGKRSQGGMLGLSPLQKQTFGRFTNHTYDPVMGQYFASARFYNPSTARFSAIDPARADVNLYRYGLNNPMSYIDRDGEIAILAPVIGRAVAAFAVGAAVEFTTQVVRNVTSGQAWNSNVTLGSMAKAGVANVVGGGVTRRVGRAVGTSAVGRFVSSAVGDVASSGANRGLQTVTGANRENPRDFGVGATTSATLSGARGVISQPQRGSSSISVQDILRNFISGALISLASDWSVSQSRRIANSTAPRRAGATSITSTITVTPSTQPATVSSSRTQQGVSSTRVSPPVQPQPRRTLRNPAVVCITTPPRPVFSSRQQRQRRIPGLQQNARMVARRFQQQVRQAQGRVRQFPQRPQLLGRLSQGLERRSQRPERQLQGLAREIAQHRLQRQVQGLASRIVQRPQRLRRLSQGITTRIAQRPQGMIRQLQDRGTQTANLAQRLLR